MSEQERFGAVGRDLAVVIPFAPKPETELTEEQEAYWWEQLEFAERKVEYAKRMLGLVAVEKGLKG
jgi:hypothetical protein